MIYETETQIKDSMVDIIHAQTEAEAYSYYHNEIPDLTPAEAYKLMRRLQLSVSPRLSRAEKQERYSKYCAILQEIRSGDKHSLVDSWEQIRRGRQ